MPKFVPVTDTERPRSEQTNDATMSRHRRFDNPHSVTKDKVDRGWVQGEVGWGVLKNFGDDERDAKAQVLRHADGANKMVKNSKGLWVKAKEIEDDVDHDRSTGLKGMGRGGRGVPVMPASTSEGMTANSDDDNDEKRYHNAHSDDEGDYRSRKPDGDKHKLRRNNDHDGGSKSPDNRRDQRSRSPVRRRNDSRDRPRYRDDSRDRPRYRRRDSRSRSRSRSPPSRRHHSDRGYDDYRPSSGKDSRSPSRSRSRSRDRHHDRSSSRRNDDNKPVKEKEERRRPSRFDSRPTAARDEESEVKITSAASRVKKEEEEDEVMPPLKITSIQVINHFHDVYSNKSISSERRMKELDILFSSTAKIMSLKTGSAYLSNKEQILNSFSKTNPTVVTVSKRIYIEMESQNMTFCVDLHRAATSPGLGDGQKENVLLYACESAMIMDVWGMVDSEHLADDTELTTEQAVKSKFWSLVKQIVESKWRGSEALDIAKHVHYHNYDHMEVWGM